MQKIKYNDASQVIRFEMPTDWAIESITSATVGITDLEATAKLAPTAATLYTATTLGAAATAGDATITLGAGATAVVQGDRLRIKSSVAGRSEDVEVLDYNSSTRVVTLTRDLRYSHTNGTAVYGMWLTYTLTAASNTSLFDESDQLILTWTPNTDDIPVRERGEVYAYLPAFSRLEERFKSDYSRGYRLIENNFVKHMQDTRDELQMLFESDGVIINHTVYDDQMIPVLLAYAYWRIARSGGEKWVDEREVAFREFDRLYNFYKKLPIWQDDDQDNVEDDEEVDDHDQMFGLERGF